jgi:hypothetical protein
MVRRLTKHVELVPDWKRSWKWASIQLSTLAIVFFSAIDVLSNSLSALPQEIIQQIPHGNHITIGLFLINIVCRLIRIKPRGNRDAD